MNVMRTRLTGSEVETNDLPLVDVDAGERVDIDVSGLFLVELCSATPVGETHRSVTPPVFVHVQLLVPSLVGFMRGAVPLLRGLAANP